MVSEGGVEGGLTREKAGQGRGDDARSAAPPAACGLPCLSSNNSTRQAPKLTPYQRKNAFILKENLEAMVAKYGIEKVGFLTLTFPRDLTLREANKRFDSFASHVLGDRVECWVNVREFTGIMRPHMHLCVAVDQDIRSGFNWEAYLEMARLSRSAARRTHAARIRELSRSLNPSPALQALWRDLRHYLPRYQFGRHELIPIRKTSSALALYVGGYIRKSIEQRPAAAKGARLISYSQDFERRVVGHAWQWNTPMTWLWRRRLEAFAKFHGIGDYSGLSQAFGPRWAWWFRDVIEAFNLPDLSAEDGSAFYSTVDPSRFAQSLENPAFSVVNSLLLYEPHSPLNENGQPIPVPRELDPVFTFYRLNWFRSPAEILALRHSARSGSRSGKLYLLQS